MYRTNMFFKFYLKDKNIIFGNLLYNFIIKNNSKIIELFIFLLEKKNFSYHDLQIFWVSEKFIELLMESKIIVNPSTNWWVESEIFEKMNYNPINSHISLSEENLEILYKKIEKWLKWKVNDDFKKISLYNNIEFTINQYQFSKVWSDRINKNNKSIWDIDKIIQIVHFIFHERAKKISFKKLKKFYKFWSWWWINSVFPVIISKDDHLIIYDKFSNTIYKKNIKWIHKDVANECFVDCSISFESYDCIIFLFSDYNNVSLKYWNRWYKLVLLETWQISYMFRLINWILDVSHVEIQWIYENKINNIIKKNDVFVDFSPMFIHCLVTKL